MEHKELLALAKKHCFGGFEVGCRMMGLVDEIEQITIQKAYEHIKFSFEDDIATLEQENRMLRARVARLTDCAGAHHATS